MTLPTPKSIRWAMADYPLAALSIYNTWAQAPVRLQAIWDRFYHDGHCVAVDGKFYCGPKRGATA